MRAAFIISIFSITISSLGQTVLSPSAPALQGSAAVAVPSSPALSLDSVNPPIADGVVPGANSTVATLSALLTNLQNDLEVTLPFATAFNDSFDFSTLDTNGAVGGPIALRTNLNNSLNSLRVNASLSGSAAMASETNAFAVPPGFSAFPLTRDTLRGLLILQNDIERMLPLLNAINSGNSTAPQATPLVPPRPGR